MKSHRFAMDGVSAHDAFKHGPVVIDADALGDGLIAIVGRNGSGKTHIIEGVMAALYRVWPSYRNASFIEHVKPADGWVQYEFSHGGVRYGLKVQADPRANGGRGKTEAYLTADAVPIAGPNLKAVDAALARIKLPSRDLMLTSCFKAQEGVKSKSGSLFARDPADRRKLVAEMLDLDDLAALAVRAGEEYRRALTRHAELADPLALAQGTLDQIALAEADLERLSAAVQQAEAAQAAHRVRLAEAEAALGLIREAKVAAVRAADEAQRVAGRLAEIDAQLATLAGRRERRAALLASAETVHAAIVALPGEEVALERLERAARTQTEQVLAAHAVKAQATTAREELVRQAERAQAAVAVAEEAAARIATAALPDGAPLEAALPALTAECAAWVARADAVEVSAETDLQVHLRQLTREAEILRPRLGMLAAIPGVPACGACPLTEDARAAQARVAAIEAELADLARRGHRLGALPREAERGAYEAQAKLLSGIVGAWERCARELSQRARALATDYVAAGGLLAAREEFARVVTAGKAARARLDAAERECAELARARGELDAFIQRQKQVVEAHRARAQQAAAIDAANLDDAEDAASAAALQMERAFVQEEFESIGVPADLGGLVRAEAEAETAQVIQQRAVRDADAELQEARSRLVRRQTQREALGDPPDLAALQARVDAAATIASDWALLLTALEPEGVPAMIMAAAGPGITATANDLLADAYGGRFSVTLVTTEPKRDGKGDKDVFDLRILDARTGGPLDQGSGGQMAFLDEAVRLAVAIYNAEQAGGACEELWRDEPSAAFDPEACREYVALLRRACDHGRFRRCWFISHSQAVWSQADRILYVHDGRVSVDVPPAGFQVAA